LKLSRDAKRRWIDRRLCGSITLLNIFCLEIVLQQLNTTIMLRNLSALFFIVWTAQAFVIQSTVKLPPTRVDLAKGFGEKPEAPKKKKSSAPDTTPPEASSSPTTLEDSSTQYELNPFPVQETDLSQGQKALEGLRRGRAELRNAELRKVKEVKEADAMMRESPDAAVIPEKVAQRMGKRMLPFVGVPLFGAMGAFVGFWYFATYKDVEFEPALVASSTIVLLAVGLVVRALVFVGAVLT
jgi:hypothetical protein